MLKHNRQRRLLDSAYYCVSLTDFAISFALAVASSALDVLGGAVYPTHAETNPFWRQESISWHDDFVW